MSFQQELAACMDGMDTIDTHEHMLNFPAMRSVGGDFFAEYDWAYMEHHLIAAGTSRAEYESIVRNREMSVRERWDKIEHLWEKCRYTGFGQCLDAAARIRHGVPEINRDTVEEIDRRIRISHETGEDETVYEKCHIVTSLNDGNTLDIDRRFYIPVMRLDSYIRPQSHFQWLGFEKEYGRPIRRLEHLTDAFEGYIRNAVCQGGVTFKLGTAIYRDLAFDKASFEEAEKGFNRMISPGGYQLFHYDQDFLRTERALENYMTHFALSVLNDMKIPVQIHTGMLAWMDNDLRRSQPEMLEPLFDMYPNVRFDLFHMGWPYWHAMGGLAKAHPNVYVNMCWAHIASPAAAVRGLEEWLESVPYHKIIGFGGDYGFVDVIPGQRYMAIKNISTALARKVESGLMTEKAACRLGHAILYDNPLALYGLEDRLQGRKGDSV